MTVSENRVPFNDLSRNQPLGDELSEKILKLVSCGPYLKGGHTFEFEANFASYVGAKYCVGLASGTVALEVALKSLQLPDQSTILLTANAGGYSSIAVRNCGYLPKYIDINDQGLISPTLKDFEDSKVGAIIVTHLYGQMCDMVNIMALANSLSIPVIEDCAQAAGARLNNMCAGSFGDISAFSFYPTKNLGAAGDAGAICTSNPKYHERALRLREYGWSTKYFSLEKGGSNFRIDEVQCLILNHKLPMLNNQNDKRLTIWAKYKKVCEKYGIPLLGIQDASFIAHLAVLRIKERDDFQIYLESLGIESAIHYPFPDYSQPGLFSGEVIYLPNTEKHCAEVISIPIFAEMSLSEIELVTDSLEKFFKGRG